jgi:hypothetical protein
MIWKRLLIIPVAVAATMPILNYLFSGMNEPHWLAFIGGWAGVVGVVVGWIALIKWVVSRPKDTAEKKKRR